MNLMGKGVTIVVAVALILAALVGGYWLYTNKIAISPTKIFTPQKVITSNPTPTPVITYAPTPTKQENSTGIQEAFAKKYNRIVADVTVKVDKIDGIHAQGTVQFAKEAGGGWFLAYRDGANWKIVQDGNGMVTCEIVDPYLFPTTMVSECTDKSGNLIKK